MSNILNKLTDIAAQKVQTVQGLKESIETLQAEVDQLNAQIGLGSVDRIYQDNGERRFRPIDDDFARYAQEEDDYNLRRYRRKPSEFVLYPESGDFPSDFSTDTRFLDREILTQTRYAPQMHRRVGVFSDTLIRLNESKLATSISEYLLAGRRAGNMIAHKTNFLNLYKAVSVVSNFLESAGYRSIRGALDQFEHPARTMNAFVKGDVSYVMMNAAQSQDKRDRADILGWLENHFAEKIEEDPKNKSVLNSMLKEYVEILEIWFEVMDYMHAEWKAGTKFKVLDF